MKNLKRALSLGLTATMLSGMMVAGAGAASYADVTSANNEKAIDVLKAVGVMTGDDKGNFNPDQKVTRAEMAVIMANMLDLDVDNFGSASIPFTDVPSWAVPYVAACYADGITSGTSATTYGSNDTVTTVQAALMMMKALGYFQYSSDFGADWSLATIRQASSIGLFDGIKAGSKDAMTRDEVAQLSLNTLEATMVQANKTGADINLGNGVIINGSVTYDEVTSGSDYAKAMNTDKKDGNYTVQLGEKLYDGNLKVKSSTTDDFGRPSEQWTYKTTEIGNYAKTADASYTGEVKAKDLYTDLGLSKTTKANLTVDGKTESDGFSVVKGGSGVVKSTGNGTITEAYVDDNGNVDIAVINVYGGEVTKVVDAKDGDAAYVMVDGKKYETEGFKVDDVVYYTQANGEIKSLAKAGVTEGVTVTRVNGSEFTADGTTYKMNKTEEADFKSEVNPDSVLDIYTDGNGFVIDVEVSKASKDYAYVLGLKNDGYTNDGTTYAKLLLADGTVIEVELDHYIENKDAGSKHDDWTNHLVEYTKNSKGKYTLNNGNKPSAGNKLKENGEINIEKGKAAMNLNGTTYYANNKTVFLVQTGDGSSATYTSYTGYENVPNLKATDLGDSAVLCKDGGSVATVVFVKDVATSSDDIVFVLGSKTPTKVSDSKAGKYWEYKAVVNGEITTIKAKSDNLKVDKLYSSISYSDKENEIVDLDNSQVYNTVEQDKDNFELKTEVTTAAKNGVMGVTEGTYVVSSDVQVFAVYNADKVESAALSDVEVGDTARVVVKNGEIVSIFYNETTDGGQTPVDPTIKKVELSNEGIVTVTLNEKAANDMTFKGQLMKVESGSYIKIDSFEVKVSKGATQGTVDLSNATGANGVYKVIVEGVESAAMSK